MLQENTADWSSVIALGAIAVTVVGAVPENSVSYICINNSSFIRK